MADYQQNHPKYNFLTDNCRTFVDEFLLHIVTYPFWNLSDQQQEDRLDHFTVSTVRVISHVQGDNAVLFISAFP